MHCANCGTPLPQGANACPSCGTVSPSFHASANSSPDGSTAMNTARSAQTLRSAEGVGGPPLPSAPLVPQKPATYYGSQPYYANEPDPYAGSATSNPYGDLYTLSPYRTDPPPPPPPTKKRKNTTTFAVLLCIVFLVLASTGGILLVRTYGMQKTAGSGQATATQQHQQTPPADKQALYNQTIATTPVMNDSLSGPSNFGLDNYTGQGGKTRCFFSQGQLHAFAQPAYFSPCYATATNYQNFVLQVKMTLVSGHSGGLVFRADSTNDQGYQFRISTDGTYVLNRIILDQQGNIQSAGETVTSGSSTLVQQGTNQPAIMAQGDTISLFINGKYVDSATDSTYHVGKVGVYVDSDASSVEGAFSNLQVWKLA